MPDRIHLTVATVVHREGRFLMVREMDNDLEVINQPAGHVEPGESLQHAALRETLEETGWQVALESLLGIYTYQSLSNAATYYRVCFSASPLLEVKDAVLDADILAPEWHSLDSLKAEHEKLRSPLVLQAVEDYLAGVQYPLSLIQNHIPQTP